LVVLHIKRIALKNFLVAERSQQNLFEFRLLFPRLGGTSYFVAVKRKENFSNSFKVHVLLVLFLRQEKNNMQFLLVLFLR